MRLWKTPILGIGLTFLGAVALHSNPTGGSVTSGSAAISGGSGTLTVNQTSRAAIINWQSFSVGNGELTQFMMPGVQSAVLNRVLGGSSSQIDGRLSANGQLFLINQNGIVIGPGGVVNAAGGFTASTRDILDSDFLNGNQHFVGHGRAEVLNLGQVSSLLGNVVLIGKRVGNYGTITAPKGTVGLVAGDDVLLGQKGADGSTITVNPSKLSKKAGQGNKIGVNNQGVISATTAQLKAANGNIYALAINNGGSIRASTVKHQGGHIWLTSQTEEIVNNGELDASATINGGRGGDIVLKSPKGFVNDVGAVVAEGGYGGVGGNVDFSGEELGFSGTVDLRAPGGKAGHLLLDPATLDVVAGGTGTITSGTNDSVSSTISADTVDGALAGESVTLTAVNGISIDQALNWSSGTTLQLNTTSSSGSTLTINQPITATNGGTLNINLGSATDLITTSANGSINVGSFILQNGNWNQVMPNLPGFSVTTDFEIQNSSTFLRATGGDGVTNPYQIVDVYGLQGIGSPSDSLLSDNFVLNGNIEAGGTATWNSGSGFNPIAVEGGDAPFIGTFDGAGHTINNLTINFINNSDGLFNDIGTGGVVKNVGLVGGSINSSYLGTVGALAGENDGTVQNCYSTMPVDGSYQVGGLVGYNTGTITDSYATGTITGSNYDIGGLVGENDGMIQNSYSPATVNGSYLVGGLVGNNTGTVSTCYATGPVAADDYNIGGLVGENSGTIQNSYATGSVSTTNQAESVGGLVGSNDSSGFVLNSYATGDVDAGFEVGGLAGYNQGTISISYATGSATGDLGGSRGSLLKVRSRRARRAVFGSSSADIGGLVGYNDSGSTISDSYSTGPVVGSSEVGGLVGYSTSGTITGSYSTGSVTGISAATDVGGLVGSDNADVIQVSYATGLVTGGAGSSNVGGFVGSTMSSTINDCYYATDGTGQSVGFGFLDPTVISYNGIPTSDITGLTLAQLKNPNSYDSAWNFGLGGQWGANGYSRSGLINNGFPYLQSAYPTIAILTPGNQTTTYNQTPTGTGFSSTDYSVVFAPGYSSLAPYLRSGPVFAVTGSNVNAGTTNPIDISSLIVRSGYAVEIAGPGTETISPKPITVSALSGVVSTYGNTPAFATDGGGSQILSGDTLGGNVSFSTTDGFSPGGYLNAGTYTYTPQITNYNSNYTITGYNSATYTINPAVLTYTANLAVGGVGSPLPFLDGIVTGFLPNDNLNNATNGTAIFSTAATSSSPAGYYAVNGSGLSSRNYVFVQAPSNATALALSVAPPTTQTASNEAIVTFETSAGPVDASFLVQTGQDSPIGIRFGAEYLNGRREGDLGYYGLFRPWFRPDGEVVDQRGRPAFGFNVTPGGFYAFDRLGLPNRIRIRLDDLLDLSDRSDLAGATGLPSTGTSLPAPQFFTLPGDFFAFDQTNPPPFILKHLDTLLATDVRDELSGPETGGGSSTPTTPASGPAPLGFLTLPGGYSAFDQTNLPPRIRKHLESLLLIDIRNALAAPQGGATSPQTTNGGFFITPGGAFGFIQSEAIPEQIQARLKHQLTAEVRDQLNAARK